MKRFLSLLTAVLLLLCCTVRAPETVRSDLSFGEMRDSGLDAALECARAKELLFRIERGEIEGERAQAALDALSDRQKRIVTDTAIAYVRYCLDVTNAENKAKYDALCVQNETLCGVLDDIQRRIMGEERLSDPSADTLPARERALVGQYEALSASLFVEYGGKRWTGDEILSDPTLSEEDFSALYEAYMTLFHGKASEIYTELLAVRNEIAERSGFASYADYAYARFFRDDTPEDAARFSARAIGAFAPVLSELKAAFFPAAGRLYGAVFPLHPTLERIGEAIVSLLPELQEPWDYMIGHELIDLGTNETRMPGSFTTYFQAYGAPFLFGSWTGGYEMIPTIAHEFGHYASLYRNGVRENPLDLAEFDAQGLELLTVLRYDILYGDLWDAAETAELFYAVYTLLDGCAEDAFQRFAYASAEPSADQLDAEYARLLDACGLSALGIDPRSWTQVMHLFSAPFCHIGYATGMIAALELYLESLRDPSEAVKIYRAALRREDGSDFRETLKGAGLRDPFREETIDSVACGLRDALCNRKNE